MAHLEICGGGASKPRNTGFKENCLETKMEIPLLSNGFEFPTIAAFKDRTVWSQAIAAKDIVPLFRAYSLADASTEDTKFEVENFSKVIQKGVEKITFESFLSVCAYQALKSYENAGEYGFMFEFNEGGDYSGIETAEGGVRGRKIKSLIATRMRATNEKVPYVRVEITFDDKDDIVNSVIVKSELSAADLEGIYDVELQQVSATASEIKFTASAGCSGSGAGVESLVAADVVVKNAVGVVQEVSFVAADPNGVYTITGTGFATGYTVGLLNVVVKTSIKYESPEVLVITVAP